MKITIFGATGSIGQKLVNQALAEGHQVTAFSRKPEALEINHPKLRLFEGDVFNSLAVAEAIKGADAVLVTLGSVKLTGNVRSAGTRNIVQAMELHQVKQLICQTTLGIGDSRANLNFFWKTIMFGIILRSVYKDHVIQESIVKQSKLDWVIVRPASFTDNTLQSTYKSGFSSDEKNLSLKISRSDVARFMLLQLMDRTYLRKTPGLSY